MPSSGIWLDSRLRYISIESKNAQNELRTRTLWSSEVGIAEPFPRRGQLGQRMSARPEEVDSAIFEY